MLKRSDIHSFLKSIGIKDNDTVLVHTSMRSLGEVEGGCDGLIDSFTSYLSDGLFIVPTHTWASVGKDNPVYDVRSSVPCIGALPTVAAFRADAHRSLHPTHSVAAFGKRAEEFIRGEENSTTPCPKGGVWQRLLDEKATVLLIGVELNRNTYIHAVDEMLDLPGRLSAPISLTVIDKNGASHGIASFRKHSNAGSEYFGNYKRAFEYCGALRTQPLGSADVGIFDVRSGTKMLKKLWSRAEYNLTEGVREIPENYYRD